MLGFFLILLFNITVYAQQSDTAITTAIHTTSQVEEAQKYASEAHTIKELSEREDTEGPYILIKEPIFSFTIRTGLNSSNNPSRTAVNTESDISQSVLFDAGVDTRIGSYDVGGHVYVGKNNYEDLKNLGSSYAAFYSYIGRRISDRGGYLRLNFDYGSNYDRDFTNSEAYTSLRMSWSNSYELKQKFFGYSPRISPSVSVSRYFYDQEQQDYLAPSAGVSFSQRFNKRLSGNLNFSWTGRNYYNFFEDRTGVERDDDNVSASTSFSYTITKFLTLSVRAGFKNNDSSLNISEYDATDFGTNLSYRKMF